MVRTFTWVLLLTSTLVAQSKSTTTTFTNSNLPRPEPQSSIFNFYILTEDGNPVGMCPPNSAGCRVYVTSPSTVAITLPDIPDAYVNHDTIVCAITKIVVTGRYKCRAAKCQSDTYTATTDNGYDAPCTDAEGRVWTIHTTQYYHWRYDGRYYYKHYDGGSGSLSH